MSDGPTQPTADDSAALSREQLAAIHLARENVRGRLRSSQPPTYKFADRVSALGLGSHALELDARGYTVIPPEKVAPGEFVERVTQAILRVAEQRTGVPHALDKPGNPGRYRVQSASGNVYLLWHLLFEDEVFEEWLENPALSAMIDHMLGGQGQLSSMMSIVRWRNPDIDEELTLGLHSDSPGSPDGVQPLHYDLVCNSALVLTPYTRKGGALAVVPGSHRLGRQPQPGEGTDRAIPVEADVGSLVLWHGGTWHGVYRRTTPGIRLNLTAYHCHRSLKTQERYQRTVPDEMLARRSARFARILGADDLMGWDKEGPDYQRVVDYRARTGEAAGERTAADTRTT